MGRTEHRVAIVDGLLAEAAHGPVVRGPARRPRRQAALHAALAVEDVAADDVELTKRHGAEVGEVQRCVEPRAEHAQIGQRGAQAHELRLLGQVAQLRDEELQEGAAVRVGQHVQLVDHHDAQLRATLRAQHRVEQRVGLLEGAHRHLHAGVLVVRAAQTGVLVVGTHIHARWAPHLQGGEREARGGRR